MIQHKTFIWRFTNFKYYLGTTITLKNFISNNETVYRTLTFYSKPETVINEIFYLKESFKKLKHKLDKWINEGSGWIIEKVEWLCTSYYEPLSDSSYIPLPKELNNSMKSLINIKNKDLKCFMWCDIRFINPQNENGERINEKDKEIASTLNYSGINFAMKAHDYELVENRLEINVNVFGYENKVNSLYISKKSNAQVLNVLLITNEGKCLY